jgi:hypothetical protein
MAFELRFTPEAEKNYNDLQVDGSKKSILKAVRKTLGFLEKDPSYPSLHSHKYQTYVGPRGEAVFESYAQNQTPGAYRVFWYYGPEKGQITIVAITPHP